MNDVLTTKHTPHAGEENAKDATTFFGFWVYLMTDLVLFASLFAVYAVLRENTFGGPGVRDIANMPLVLVETLALLTSSFTMGLTLLAARAEKKSMVVLCLIVTGLLGATFLGLELSEFRHLALAGNGINRSGFLSAYTALIGTHGLHIFAGLLWIVSLVVAIVSRGLNRSNMRKLALLSLFWHFLDLIWIFIFTLVYLFGII